MTELQHHILLIFSLPIYAVLIPLEILLSNFRQSRTYKWKDTLMNIYLNVASAGIDLLFRGVALFVLIFFFNFKLPIIWHPVVYWVALFLLEDVLFWLEHFVDHKVRMFWAVHITHHSSDEYNLTTGFRSSVLMPLYRFIYFIPLALLGFQPADILFVYAITQIYGIMVHTKSIKKMPAWVDFIFVTPSHHRVHHASNTPYLDKNMGMVLIIWDRLFGTFQKELPSQVPVYGITHKIEQPFHPTNIIFHEWKDLIRDVKQVTGWRNKAKYFLMPPGWRADGLSQTTRQLQDKWNESAALAPNHHEH